MKEVTLETERLLLRWFRKDDFADFCEICAEPEVMLFLGDGKPMTPMFVWKQIYGISREEWQKDQNEK